MAIIASASGGTRVWSDTNTWVGGVAPTAADDAQLDATSGSVTIDSGAVCRSLDCTGYMGTLTHNAAATLTIGDATAGTGNIALKLVSGMGYTKNNADTSAISFNSTSATVQTVDSGTKTLGNVTFGGGASGGSWQLVVGLTIASTSTLTLTRGTLDTNGQTCSWGFLVSSNSNTRTLTLGASSITITCASGTSLDFTTSTNLTLNVGTSLITINNNSTFNGGSKAFNNLTANNGMTYSGANTFTNFTCTPTAGSRPAFVLNNNITVTGTLTLTASDSTTSAGRVQFFSSTFPSVGSLPRTITAAAVSLTNVDFTDVIAAGAASPFTGTRLGGTPGSNTNITVDSPRTVYWMGTGNGNFSDPRRWSTTSSPSPGTNDTYAPLPQDVARWDANSIDAAGRTIVLDPRICSNINFTGVTNSPTLNTGLQPTIIPGDFILAPAMTIATNGRYALNGRGSHILSTFGVSLSSIVSTALNIAPYNGGSYTLNSDLLLASTAPAVALTHSIGTFNANGYNVTTPTFSSNNSNTRTLNMGSGTWTLTGTGTVWNTSTVAGLTVQGTVATVIVTDVSATAKTFANRNTGKIGTLTFSGGGVNSTISFDPNGSYGTMNLGAPKTYNFNTTGTMTVDTLNATGSAGNIITIQTATPGTPAVISKAGGMVSCDYLSVKDSTATGGATWFAGANSTSVSGNSGWLFQAAPRVPRAGSTVGSPFII